MDISSFLTSLGTSFVIFIVLMLLFAWLSTREGNAVVYYPNRIVKGLEPWEGGSKTRNPFAWISEALSSTEQDVIHMSGIDTAVYFVFLSTVLGILVLSGVVLLPVLLPVAATDDGVRKSAHSTTSNGTFSDLDKLSMANIQEKSPRLWAFLVATYWVSVVTYFLSWKAYKHVSALRATALKSDEVKPEQFAVLVRDLPDVTTEGFKKKLLRAEAIYEESERKGQGMKPTHKAGFLGLCGEKVDSIEYYNEKIKELTQKFEAEQKLTLREKQQGSALVFFTSRVTAASASQSLHAQMVDNWTVTEAPEPRQLIWSNLTIKFYERIIRQYAVYFIVFLTIIFYMIPITFISAFTTLENLRKLLPFLKPVVDVDALKTVLEAYLPQLALIIFLALLPKLLLFLSKTEGIPSGSHVIRAASGKYFYFIVFNVFIGVTIGGTLFSELKTIEKNPNSIFEILAKSLPGNATFFITFVALKFFVGYGLELSRIVPLIIYHVKRKYLCKTEAELKEAWFPGDISYATRVPTDMLIVTIVLCYSVIAPVIIPFGVLYFALGWLVLRNQALKVYVPAYESYGRMWPHMHTRILGALLLYQATMLGYFGVSKFLYTPILIPLPILSLVFFFICRKKFYGAFCHTALEVANQELKEAPHMEQIFKSFIPPSLISVKLEDEQFEDALSQVSRSESFV
ncbi:CSC1-like protein ERD4 [Hibiscus syriacus]|uniref:CSC1-like protein ERD4 n=1 Tax=Hibiscus syriacus TaxID=106335 RepID=A0A6A2WJM7_HIBSY|nr:CSC1-like protein ERD4 [Hibiscus syriacus]